MARLVIFFAVHPGRRFHLRELKRRTHLSSASLQRELRRLVALGALVREEDNDDRVYFSADETHDAWRAWVLLLRSAADPADVLREALVGAPGLEGAFIYGSTARGDVRSNSDIDVFVIASQDEPARDRRKRFAEAEFLIGRPMDIVEYTSATARQRTRSANPFLSRILAEPKVWVYGSAETLADLEAP